MAKTYINAAQGTDPIVSSRVISVAAPFDVRCVVDNYDDLFVKASGDGSNGFAINELYKGLTVVALDTNEIYILTKLPNKRDNATAWRNNIQWKRVGDLSAETIEKIESLENISLETIEKIHSLSEGEFPGFGGSEDSDYTPGIATVEGVIDYVADAIEQSTPDLSGYALKEELPVVPENISAFNNDAGYITSNDLPDFLTSSDIEDYVKVEDLEGYLKPEDIEDLAKKSDLDGYVKVEDAVDYLSSSDLDDYATKSYVDGKISDLIGGAPQTLDTLKEIADALHDNATMQDIADAISTKANADDVYTKAEVDAKIEEEVGQKIDELPDEGSFPEIGGSNEPEFTPGFATVEGVIDYVAEAIEQATPDLSGYALKSELPVVPENVSAFTNDAGYITSNDLPDFLTSSDIEDYVKVEDLVDYLKPEDIEDLAKKSDLEGCVRIEDILDFLTSSDLDDYATKSYVDGKIADLIDGAPQTLDTLKEIAAALEDNATMQDIADAISTKANADDVYTKAEADEKIEEKIEELSPEGTFPSLVGSEDSDYVPGLATVEGVIDYVAEAIEQSTPDLSGYALKSELPVVPENVSAFTNDAGYLTEHQDLSDYAEKDYVDVAIASIDIPEEGSFPDDSDSDSDFDDGFATVQGVMDYVNAFFEKKKEELTEPDYVYINGVRFTGTETPTSIYQMNPFELYEDEVSSVAGQSIEVKVASEIYGFNEGDPETTIYAELFTVDIPEGYTLEVHGWDDLMGRYSDTTQPMMVNPRYENGIKYYGTRIYYSYERYAIDEHGNIDPYNYIKPSPTRYKIIIKKNNN